VAGRFDALMATLPDLVVTWPLPEAPWFESGARWSVRRVLLHVIAETAQHADVAQIPGPWTASTPWGSGFRVRKR
jgi:Protein of unknown function (DUF664)